MFVLPSPALSQFVGVEVPGARGARCDVYGDVLCCAHMEGGDWTKQHDANLDSMLASARKSGIRGDKELANIFRGSLPPQARRRMDADIRSDPRRRGYVPDFRLFVDGRTYLHEVKTIHYGPSRYPPLPDIRRGRRRAEARATNQRAAKVPREYEAMLARKDRAWCDTPEGEVGPLRRVLRSYPPLSGLCFGHVGEASDSVEQLLQTVARTTVDNTMRLRRARSAVTAKAMVAQQLRRAWGMAAWTANTELLLARRALLETGPSPRGHAQGRHGNARGGGATANAEREFRRAETATDRERTARGSAARAGGGGF